MTVEGDGVHVITAFVHVHVHNCAFANVQLATVKGSTVNYISWPEHKHV